MLSLADAIFEISSESYRLMSHASTKAEKKKANDLMNQNIWALSVIYELPYEDAEGAVYDVIDTLEKPSKQQ